MNTKTLLLTAVLVCLSTLVQAASYKSSVSDPKVELFLGEDMVRDFSSVLYLKGQPVRFLCHGWWCGNSGVNSQITRTNYEGNFFGKDWRNKKDFWSSYLQKKKDHFKAKKHWWLYKFDLHDPVQHPDLGIPVAPVPIPLGGHMLAALFFGWVVVRNFPQSLIDRPDRA